MPRRYYYIDRRKPGTYWNPTSSQRLIVEDDEEETETSPNASGASTGGSPPASSSKSAMPYQPPLRSSWRDTRRPGTYWSPANNRQTQKSERERKASPAQAAASKRPKEEVAARSELADALRTVFGDVEERGSRAVRQYREGE